jgi:hypothetical protein
VDWRILLTAVGAVIAVVYAFVQYRLIETKGPMDAVGNGITIGKAKAFDNRTLALRIERLSASLAAMKVVNQRAAENVSTFQGQISSELSRTLTLNLSPQTAKGNGDGPAADTKEEGDKGSRPAAAPSSNAAGAESNTKIGLAAGDILNDQLNLASQILNLEMLYERSLTDRLLGEGQRLQTVLGFQISITPPAGYERCVAIAEIAVRVKGNAGPVSLVALIPQEKTYNSQSFSSSAQSIGGSAVAGVLTLGLGAKGEARQLFIHRDSDTIAFERDPRSDPTLFDNDKNATVFGWEFRPVLGRSTVSAGIRQLLAVVALPAADQRASQEVELEVCTRSYWRRYSAKRQSSSRKWHLMPFKIDGSNTNNSETQVLKVPNTHKIQESLAPIVSEIKWVNCGADRVTVIVKGSNFFSGTKVVIGGKVHREEDLNLTLKSDQALEFETSITALATGDAVLSGRFGASFRLRVPESLLPVKELYIARASIKPNRYTDAFRVTIEVAGMDGAVVKDFTTTSLTNLPKPILFVGAEPILTPYDFTDVLPVKEPKRADTCGVKKDSPSPLQTTAKSLRVEAWIPVKLLGRNSSITFRIPFCGTEYQASQPLSLAEPTVVKVGGDSQKTVLWIAHPLRFAGPVSVELDRVYREEAEGLKKRSDFDYMFEVSTDTASKYQNLVLRDGTAEPYLLPIPLEEQPKTSVEAAGKPPQITKGDLGPVEWSGTALDAITAVNLYTSASNGNHQPVAPSTPAGTPAQFTVYEGGKRIEVYFTTGSTNYLGRAEVEFQTALGNNIRVPLIILQASP